MRQQLTTLLLVFCSGIWAQQTDAPPKSTFIFTPEIMVGYSAPSNENFPERDPQKQALLNFGWHHTNNPQEWATRLKKPRTGFSASFTDLGNFDELGFGLTFMPYIEFGAFRHPRYSIQVGMGATYFNKTFDPVSNPRNMAVSTDVLWSFRTFMHYKLIQGEKLDWRAGVGYFHHSNGHTRLPNQGLNSFLVSVSADLKNRKNPAPITTYSFERSRYDFITARAGLGISVLSGADPFNDKLPVYTFAGAYGRVYNNTWKLSVGFYYRFYQHYYDYITGNESLVQDGQEFDSYKDSPFFNASTAGLSVTGEVLINHVGLEVELGWNLFKPAYKIDYRINEGWDNPPREIPENWVLGEYDTKFRLKHAIASRMGLKYYLLGTDAAPIHNFYVAAHINANLGQADFSELSLGYVYSLGRKVK